MTTTLAKVMSDLEALADPQKAVYKAQQFNIQTDKALGIYQADLKALAKRLPKDVTLALALYETGIYEARLLCAKIFPIAALRSELLEKWVADFENWEVCDTFCMGLVAKSPFALEKIAAWANRPREFERRASFATMAAYCMADKKAENSIFNAFFSLIEQAAADDRIYVKKAVNWALRNIGKRNVDLHHAATACAQRLLNRPEKSAQWIASDALRQWNKPAFKYADYPRAVYRP